VSARRNAAPKAGETQESRTAAYLQRRVVFGELDAQVKDGDVRTVGLTWNRSRHLGPLAGAHAGVTEDKELSRTAKIKAAVLATSPRTGTIFVSFADGTRHETVLRLGTDDQRQAIDAAVTRFNAMAGAAAKAGDHEASENGASEKQ
jgi:hypothetical protein